MSKTAEEMKTKRIDKVITLADLKDILGIGLKKEVSPEEYKTLPKEDQERYEPIYPVLTFIELPICYRLKPTDNGK